MLYDIEAARRAGASPTHIANLEASNLRSTAPATKSSGTFISRGGASNALTGDTAPKTQDTIALESLQKELSFNRVKTQAQEEDQAKLRIQQRKAATASADFQQRAGALEIEQRQSGLGREISALKRSARQQQAQVLSGAAGLGNLGSSSSKAAQIASASNLKRETAYAGETEARAKKADILREEQIAANLSATLLSLTDPTKVIQDASGQIFVDGKLTTAKSQGAGIEGFKEAPTPESTASDAYNTTKAKLQKQVAYAKANATAVKGRTMKDLMPNAATLKKYGLV